MAMAAAKSDRLQCAFLPSFAGQVSASYADGGVMRIIAGAFDPSVAV